MERKRVLELRRLQVLANEETDRAAEKWGANFDDDPERDFEIGITVLIEELGKLTRTHHKEIIAVDPEVREYWLKEHKRRFVTLHSILNHLYLNSPKPSGGEHAQPSPEHQAPAEGYGRIGGGSGEVWPPQDLVGEILHSASTQEG